MMPSQTPFGLAAPQQSPQQAPMAPAPLGLQAPPLNQGMAPTMADPNQLQLGQPSQNGQGLQVLSSPSSVSDAAKKQALAKALMSSANIQSTPESMQTNLSGIIPGNYTGQGG